MQRLPLAIPADETPWMSSRDAQRSALAEASALLKSTVAVDSGDGNKLEILMGNAADGSPIWICIGHKYTKTWPTLGFHHDYESEALSAWAEGLAPSNWPKFLDEDIKGDTNRLSREVSSTTYTLLEHYLSQGYQVWKCSLPGGAMAGALRTAVAASGGVCDAFGVAFDVQTRERAARAALSLAIANPETHKPSDEWQQLSMACGFSENEVTNWAAGASGSGAPAQPEPQPEPSGAPTAIHEDDGQEYVQPAPAAPAPVAQAKGTYINKATSQHAPGPSRAVPGPSQAPAAPNVQGHPVPPTPKRGGKGGRGTLFPVSQAPPRKNVVPLVRTDPSFNDSWDEDNDVNKVEVKDPELAPEPEEPDNGEEVRLGTGKPCKPSSEFDRWVKALNARANARAKFAKDSSEGGGNGDDGEDDDNKLTPWALRDQGMGMGGKGTEGKRSKDQGQATAGSGTRQVVSHTHRRCVNKDKGNGGTGKPYKSGHVIGKAPPVPKVVISIDKKGGKKGGGKKGGNRPWRTS